MAISNFPLNASMILLFPLAGMPASSIDPIRGNAKEGSERLFVYGRFTSNGENGPLSGWTGLITINPESGAWRKLVEGGFEACVSPDGKRLALNRLGDTVLYTCDAADGKSLHKVKDMGEIFNVACWSPDGGEILVRLAKRIGTSSVTESWRVKADGSGAARQQLPDGHFFLDWSRNGSFFLTFLRSPEAGGQLYLVRPDGTIERQLTRDGDNTIARFSPDGKRIAYLHRQDTLAGRPVDVWTIDLDGKNNREVLASKTTKTLRLCWSPDGKGLALIIVDLKKDVAMREPNARPVIIDLEGKIIRTIQLPGRDMLLLGDWSR
jgi:WD40 repeat protein